MTGALTSIRTSTSSGMLRGELTRRDLIEEAIQQQGREVFEECP
jgi:hypothetical protein